jgi:pimeloyl-ACP methyl ester carboxylesterase
LSRICAAIHNYRWRLSLADGERQYDQLESKLQQAPAITVPTITIASDFDGSLANGAGYRKYFTGKYAHRILPGIGHNVPPGGAGSVRPGRDRCRPAVST